MAHRDRRRGLYSYQRKVNASRPHSIRREPLTRSSAYLSLDSMSSGTGLPKPSSRDGS